MGSIKKNQTRITGMDEQIIALYAKGLSNQEIVEKQVYQVPTEVQARENLTALSQKWQAKYPLVAKGWEDNWANIATFFDYPADIRKAIYTTNAVESLNSVIRRVIKKRNVFPMD
ncbi:transposase, IS256 family, partial [Glaesserella parasuis SW114]